MKRLMLVLGLGLISGSVYAACVGPYCWDDTGATVNGYSLTANGFDVPVLSSTSISQITGGRVGRLVICNTCNAAVPNNGYAMCVATSSANGIGSYIILNSTGGTTICR